MHVLVLPGMILGLMVAHLALVFHHKHTQFPGPGRDEKSVVRIAFFVAPVLAFVITRRVCLGLQRRDRDTVLHGRETGTVRRLPHGEYVEVHEPLSQARRFTLTQHEQPTPYELGPRVDANGVARRVTLSRRLRARPARAMHGPGTQIPKPTQEEYRGLTGGDHHR
jgi:ubiquinol-cytochrome c reductase cytochrome b subunit